LNPERSLLPERASLCCFGTLRKVFRIMEARSSVFFETVPFGTRAPAGRARRVWRPSNGAYEVELRAPADIGSDLAAWQALATRGIEPTLFADPDMLLPALQHLSEGRQANLLLVWQAAGASRVLRGLFPVFMPRLPIAPGEVRLWRPCGFPLAPALVDRDYAGAVFGAVFSFCASRGARCSSFALSGIAQDGPLAAAIHAEKRRSEALPLPALVARRAPAKGDEPEAPASSGLAGTGRVERARTPAQVRDAVETLLVLDAAAAKGCGGTALIQDAGTASFLRTVTRQLARRRQCRVDVLKRDGESIAAALVLESAEAVWLWRTAGPAPDVEGLLSPIAACARRAGKSLVLTENARIAQETAAALGFEPIPLIDLLVSTRTGLSPSAAVAHIRARIDRRLRAVASGGLQRLMRA
jgi:hypothetical protein